MTAAQRRAYGPELVELLFLENDPGSKDRLLCGDRRKLEKLGLATIGSKKNRARLTNMGRAVALADLAERMPPELADLARAMRSTAGHLEMGHQAPPVHVELPAAGPPPEAPPASAIELAAKAALGLVPGLSVTIRFPTRGEEQLAGVAGSMRIRIDVTTSPGPGPEVEALVPEGAFWAKGWAVALLTACGRANVERWLPPPQKPRKPGR